MTLVTQEMAPIPVESIVDLPKENLEEATKELIKNYAHKINPKDEADFKRHIQGESAGNIVDLHHEYADNPEELVTRINTLRVVIGPIFGSERKRRETGILGEVALRLALEEMGIQQTAPTTKEDTGAGIDTWAKAKVEKDSYVRLAIQIKTLISCSQTAAYDLRNAYGTTDSGVNLKEYSGNMGYYLEKNGLEAIPVLIEMPNAFINDAPTYNIITGAPTKAFVDELYDCLEPILYPEG